jgi:Mn2+/Fe2+ NRAMP family transporter
LYVRLLQWLTLVLFAYVAALFATAVPWKEALAGIFVPQIVWSAAFATTIVAIFGTTISPYLFFWQSSQEAEDLRVDRRARSLLKAPKQAAKEYGRIRADTLVGMAFSNIIALAIIITTATALHKTGISHVESSAQAAAALRPLAGPFAFMLFALGIIGTGLLAVPVLAGSAAYAVAEGLRWRVGLSRKPKEAIAFYSILTAAAVLGMAVTLSPIDPIEALYWSAVINGVVAVPVMTITMRMAEQGKVMGKFTIVGWLRWLGWAATGAMMASVLAMIVGWIV